ncbi:MAG: helix-turn-helix transcriptional regulator [Lachnospiraceae bacterium]|nr:helix-turn-helix transcriptional regulator [Lachnospiraceae bacterium]
MRKNLKEARHKAGMTQKQVAEYLNVIERHYKAIEYGERLGSIDVWDKLEDLFHINQRKLRENSENHPYKGENL